MYSLGAVIYAVHCKGNPPFKNHDSLGGLRDNAGKPVPGMERLDSDLQGTHDIARIHWKRSYHPFESFGALSGHAGLTATPYVSNSTVTSFLLFSRYINA